MNMVLDDETPICIICLGQFEVDEEIRTLPCKHEYHKDCIDPWIHTNGTCPLCKQNVRQAITAKGASNGPRQHQSSAASVAPAMAHADNIFNAGIPDGVVVTML
eukprot:TRINITY_DN12535_c1_g2_i11.p3 TRINITY_DN12535_c1_g2~~TRINITY_DN12535_c1_g2_i11.p3  ORF type:complete len:104 (+),score=24.95 TRINITY_DN12535_c1_g2_i11:963-1274(+)